MVGASFEFSGFASYPGISELRETAEGSVTWGKWSVNESYIIPINLSGAARDSSNTPTTVLRPGLMLKGGTDKLWLPWVDPTDAAADFDGVLLWAANTQDFDGDNPTFFGWAILGGQIKADTVFMNGGDPGDALPSNARTAINTSGHWLLDDQWHQS